MMTASKKLNDPSIVNDMLAMMSLSQIFVKPKIIEFGKRENMNLDVLLMLVKFILTHFKIILAGKQNNITTIKQLINLVTINS
jgi:hypothetical protein